MSVRVFGGIGGAALQLKLYAARSNPIAARFNRVAYCVVPSSGDRGESKMEKKEMKPPAEHDESTEHADVMAHSFGEGYRTRSEEEGFGGIYGRNDPDDDDESQGCEVKEKDKA